MSPIASYVIQTLVTLVGVAALALVVLYAARRAGVGRPVGPIDVVGKCPLDGRRMLYLVRTGAIVHLVGSSEAGLSKLGEMPATDLFPPDAAPPKEPPRDG